MPAPPAESSPLVITYRFARDRKQLTEFQVRLDPVSLSLLSLPERESLPEWSRLEFHKCPHCPLSAAEHPFCPLVVAIFPVVSRFSEMLSHEKIELIVHTAERYVVHQTTVQRGVSSLIGLLIAVSGCPHSRYFKPMARFHLPLASAEETEYRALSMYLLAQYFVKEEGGRADFDLAGLRRIYENIHTVNVAIAKRLRAVSTADASINAVIMLDMFAKSVPFTIETALKDLRYLFTPYLDPAL